MQLTKRLQARADDLASQLAVPVEHLIPFMVDFKLFLRSCWRVLGLPAPTPIQLDIADWLQNGPRFRMVKSFRGVGKSYETSALACWTLFCDPAEKILVVSGASDKAVEFSTMTKRLIAEHPLLEPLRLSQEDKRGNLRDSVEAFDVRGATVSQVPSVRSKGITGQLTGGRATLIIADDVETPNNSETVTLREKIAERTKEFGDISTDLFDENAQVVKRGDIIWLGTDQTEETLYKRIQERGFTVRVWPSEVPDAKLALRYGGTLAPMVTSLQQPPGTPTDPSRFNLEVLAHKKANHGRSRYAMQFMLDPSLADEERYPLKLRDLLVMDVVDPIKGPVSLQWGTDPKFLWPEHEIPPLGLTGDACYRPFNVSDEWADWETSIMYIDPAGRGADESGYCVMKLLHGKLFVLALGGLRGGYDETALKTILQTAKRWGVHHIISEPNFGDGMFTKLLQGYVNQNAYKAVCEDAEWARGQKETRILDTLEPLFNQHRIVMNAQILRDDRKVEARDAYLRASYQITRLTRERDSLKKDDRVEALAGAANWFLKSMDIVEVTSAERWRQEQFEKELTELYGDCILGTTGTSIFNKYARSNPW